MPPTKPLILLRAPATSIARGTFDLVIRPIVDTDAIVISISHERPPRHAAAPILS